MTETAKASIVVGVDGSEHATHALRWAAREAELHGAELTAVLAWDLFNQLHPGGDRTFDPAYDEAAADRALLAVIETGLGAEGAPTVRRRPVCDLPAAGLLSAAEGADLLVLGARGLGGFRGLLLGSVSQQCLNHATGPVAIVRTTAPGSADDDAARDEATPGTTADDTALGPEPETQTSARASGWSSAWTRPRRRRRPSGGRSRRGRCGRPRSRWSTPGSRR
jgi:nucleotide-binding universal stress UspA family protein